MNILYSLLRLQSSLFVLFIINLLGTIYGYYWYGGQLFDTEGWLRLFVPDSPTASLYFCIVLFLWLLKKRSGLVEALAYTTLVKYGIWAVAMNGMVLYVEGELDPIAFMLIGSHAAMAIQAFLFAPMLKVKKWHFAAASIWILQDLIFDYVFGTMPSYHMLADYQNWIALFTFWLSIFVILFAYYQLIFKKRA